MNRRMAMGGDTSLNVPLRDDSEGTWQDFLVDSEPLQDERVAEAEESQMRHELLIEAMQALNDRERHILTERRLRDDPKTLEELSPGLRRQPRAHPPDRGARLREAAEGADEPRRRTASAAGWLMHLSSLSPAAMGTGTIRRMVEGQS